MLSYAVAAKYLKGPEQILAKFTKSDEAKQYIFNRLENDATLKVQVTYLLYDMGELLETFDQSGAGTTGSSGSNGDAQSSSGQGQTQYVSPSPLLTSLRPKGLPVASFKDIPADEKKK
jgi:hypothetical protein